MKILLFIDSLTGAGAQRQLTNLAVGLKSRAHTVLISTYTPLEYFREHIESHGVDYQCFDKAYRFDLSPVGKLHKSIKRFQPDVVIAFLRTPSIYAEMVKAFKPGMKLIVSERAGVDLGGFSSRDRLAGLGHLMATRVVTNSHDYLQCMINAIPALKARTSVIYNGVEDNFLKRGNTRLGLSHNQPAKTAATITRFCVVANRANRQKAPDLLVKAMLHLKEQGVDNFTLDWIGPVEFQSELVIRVNEAIAAHQLENHWHWYGGVEAVRDIYRNYDAFVLPSRYEGVANTLCEAMCCALPVIATDIADNRQIIEPAEAGLLCQVDNPRALANALQTFMQLPPKERQRLGNNAYHRACELFSMQTFIDRWESLCLSILEKEVPHVRH